MSKCVSRTFKISFKNVSIKFCLKILLGHGTHRSYLSRRRADASPYHCIVTLTIILPFRSSSKKDRDKDSSRKRSSSAVKLDKLEGPAAKMARAIGTDPSKEARFLEENMKKSSDRKVVKPRLLPN